MRLNCWASCSFDKWFNLLSDVIFQSVVITIPPEVVAYLREDGIVLPQEAVAKSTLKSTSKHSDWGEGDEDENEIKRPSFPDFSQQLSDALNKLGGSVFIKLNWSAPTDVSWIIAGKTLRCTSLEDIYLLLKSSDKIAEDLSRKSRSHHGFYVVLKRWHDIHPGSEYRCFVYHNQLVGICQRDCTAYYKHIRDAQSEIIESICSFFQVNLERKFLLPNYVFDVVRKDGNQMFLVDINPFDSSTSVLFTTEELKSLDNNAKLPEFRFLGEEPGYQPKYHGVPLDATAGSMNLHATSLLEQITAAIEEQSLETAN